MLKFKAELVERKGNVGSMPFTSMLVTFNQRIKDWRGFWATVFIPRYTEKIQQNFETEGELSGYTFGWPDLNPAYAAWKARHFPGTKILERTRELRESLAPGGNSNTVIEAGPTSLRFGTRVTYARFHQQTRPFLPRITVAEWTPLAREWVMQQAKESGLSA